MEGWTMSDTPETDAIADFYLAKAFSKDPADRTVPCQFAARLERDLNRAIRERDEALHAIHTYKCETEAWELLQEARRERDEAREERDKLQVMRKEVVAANKGAKINAQVSNSLAGKLNQAERERDEARAVADELASAASHCLGWHDCRLRIGEKITATLQRWRRIKGEQ